MSRLGIRDRVLLAALLPVVLVVPLFAAAFIGIEVADMETAHRQRALALARQIAAASEFALFTRNTPALEALVESSAGEPEVRSVSLLGAEGASLAAAGSRYTPLPSLLAAASAGGDDVTRGLVRLIVLPVFSAEIPLEQSFDSEAREAAAEGTVLGYVALEVTRDSVVGRQRALMLVGVLATVAGLLFGALVAVWLSRGVTAPILEVFRMVERFGRGDLSARVASAPSSPLRTLEEGLNRMAERIERGRGELEARIAEATAELRLKKDEAERANSAKSRFLAVASHDLRQPIHALRLFLESLREEVRDQGRAGALLDRIQATVDSTAAMFDALLDISKLEAGVIEKRVEHFPVQALLQRIEMMFSPIALEHGLRFSVVRSSAWVRTDPALAERLLQNLVANALKYTRSGGVLVGCRRRAAALSIEVWDSGPGIAPEHQREIFYEFFQLNNPARETSRGLGLGLAIVERISRLLDHPVRVRSRPGRGSMFSLEVPYGRALAATPLRQRVPQAAHRFDGVRIAVVDDEEPILHAMGELLRRWGCAVTAARSQAELLDQLAVGQAGIDLLICDYRLQSGENGLGTIEGVSRALGHKVPAIIITGDTAPERLKEAHGSGLRLLHKPVAPDQLRKAMREALRPRAAPQA